MFRKKIHCFLRLIWSVDDFFSDYWSVTSRFRLTAGLLDDPNSKQALGRCRHHPRHLHVHRRLERLASDYPLVPFPLFKAGHLVCTGGKSQHIMTLECCGTYAFFYKSMQLWYQLHRAAKDTSRLGPIGAAARNLASTNRERHLKSQEIS